MNGKSSFQKILSNVSSAKKSSNVAAHVPRNDGFLHKCITLVALSNPEPGYKNTRHNAGRLIINNMLDQLKARDGVQPSLGSMKTMANIQLLNGKKMTTALDRIYGEGEAKKYSVHLENFKGSHKKVNYQIFTPSLTRVDGTEDTKTAEQNQNRVSFILAYVDGTAMNNNGPKVMKFLQDIPSLLKENVKTYDASNVNIKSFVVADDKDVKLGSIQIRSSKTSNRGHNGYLSCQNALEDHKDLVYSKLSIGVGKPPVDENQLYDQMVLADYVLGYFKPREISILKTDTTEKIWDLLLIERNL